MYGYCCTSSFSSSCHGLGEAMLMEIYIINVTKTVVVPRPI